MNDTKHVAPARTFQRSPRRRGLLLLRMDL